VAVHQRVDPDRLHQRGADRYDRQAASFAGAGVNIAAGTLWLANPCDRAARGPAIIRSLIEINLYASLIARS
jgi:hypothetical protein